MVTLVPRYVILESSVPRRISIVSNFPVLYAGYPELWKGLDRGQVGRESTAAQRLLSAYHTSCLLDKIDLQSEDDWVNMYESTV